jgi:predicted small secreted protein
MSDHKRKLLYAGLVLLALPAGSVAITGCNTVEGAGEDVKAVGNAVEEGAEEAGQEIGEEAGEID